MDQPKDDRDRPPRPTDAGVTMSEPPTIDAVDWHRYGMNDEWVRWAEGHAEGRFVYSVTLLGEGKVRILALVLPDPALSGPQMYPIVRTGEHDAFMVLRAFYTSDMPPESMIRAMMEKATGRSVRPSDESRV